MGWKETNPVLERYDFIQAVEAGLRTVTALCAEFGISRKTGYKWLERFDEAGRKGLHDRSRAPHGHPNAVPESVRERILNARKKHPTWGPRKLLPWLESQGLGDHLPSASTAGEILQREGVIRPRRRRSSKIGPGIPLSVIREPNDVWCADFKGQFRLRNGRYCYPFTLSDGASRFLLACTGLYHPTTASVQPILERTFREFGLPRSFRTDNGHPFASHSLRRLTRLSVWLIQLGILPEQIELGHPEQNGRHERMHRTLKQETTRPPGRNLYDQQKRFDAFQHEYNHERPHEALGQRPPATHHRSSNRKYPTRLPNIEYPSHYEVRLVTDPGCISWKHEGIYVTEALIGQRVGLVEILDGVWRVYFSTLELGIMDLRKHRPYHGVRKVSPMCPV